MDHLFVVEAVVSQLKRELRKRPEYEKGGDGAHTNELLSFGSLIFPLKVIIRLRLLKLLEEQITSSLIGVILKTEEALRG